MGQPSCRAGCEWRLRRRTNGLPQWRGCCAAVVVGAWLLLTVWPSAWAGDDVSPDLARLRARGELRLGLQDGAFPFAYLPAHGATHVGFSVDVCERVLARVSQAVQASAPSGGSRPLKSRVISVTSKTRVPLLLNGTIDLECGATSASKARVKLGRDDEVGVAFSQMIFWSDVAAAVADVPRWRAYRHVSQLAELSEEKPIVTTSGSTSVKHLNALERAQKRPLARVYADKHVDAFSMLKSDEASAFVMDRVLLRSLLDPRRFRLLDGRISDDPGESYGLMMRKSDHALRALVEVTLSDLKRSGEFTRLYARWFLQPVPVSRVAGSPPGVAGKVVIGLPMSEQLQASLRTRAVVAAGR